MGVLRLLSRDIVNSLGYDIRRIPRSSDVATAPIRSGDPITYEYMPRVRGSAVLDIRLDEVRGLNSLGLRLGPECHPFVMAAVAARNSASEADAIAVLQDVLGDYYDTVRPLSALEAVGLEEHDAPGLKGVPAVGWMYPWVDKSVADIIRGRQASLRSDALHYGKFLPFSEGITAFGPVGARKLTLEVDRLHRLVVSITDSGFNYDRKSPMKVGGLRRGNSYRWIVWAGHHRFSACAAFSITSLPAMVVEVVRREDCEYWPQVVAGTYTPQGALRLFDRLYDGVPARICESWMTRTGQRSGVALYSEAIRNSIVSEAG